MELYLTSPPADILNAMYGGLIQAWLDAGQSILPEVPQATAGDHSTPFQAATRNPAEEEKVRLILLSALSLWMLFAQNPTTKAKLFNVVLTLSDPAKWAVVAGIFWGP